MQMRVYPLKFSPILQEKIWGGKKLEKEFNKVSDFSNIGESWELSGVEGYISIISNGEYIGSSLIELLNEYRSDLVGKKVYKKFKNKFPLLFKFIDASDNLSIQLHPNDELAGKRHNSFGKTEMWYVLSADEDSKLYAGFNKELSEKTYLESFEKGKLLENIHIDKVKTGDSFFIDVGTIHAIGKGIVLAEIQQTSNITYRVYDWDRVDDEGLSRELHTDLALGAIDFSKVGTCKLDYPRISNVPNKIFSCQYFTTNKLIIDNDFKRDISEIDSFIVYMCVKGKGEVKLNNKSEFIMKGDTVLIPGIAKEVFIKAEFNLELLEVYI